jgi:hypothetical protein
LYHGDLDDSNYEDINNDEMEAESIREFDVMVDEFGYYALTFLEHINDYLPQRLAFTSRELEAAHWIVNTLKEMGFNEEQIEVQTFRYDVLRSSWIDNMHLKELNRNFSHQEDESEWIDYSQNVILTIPGISEEKIVIGAHYDSARASGSGIVCNGGGVVLLLESAYRMQDLEHYYTLQYVFFGAEEVVFDGSFYFVDSLSEIDRNNLMLMINADVVIAGPNLIYATGYLDEMPDEPLDIIQGRLPTSYVQQNEVTRQIDRIVAELNKSYAFEFIPKPRGIFGTTDHIPFLELGIPIMYIYGTYPVEYPEIFNRFVMDTPNDNLDFVMRHAPGRIETALNSFGLLLESILTFKFDTN